ncbi:MAG: hypothetical protein J5671_10005 [Bacteroidaceae bacterium]|nr:hypothetical protein [Bacteroidaceae bacterium]
MTNEEYIAEHREEDVRQLALKRAPEGVDMRWCLQQIEGWQLARRKLPRWAATEGLWYPVRLSMEQCSSEATAQYKQQVVERLLSEDQRKSMVDLTGGLGVDFSFLAPLFQEATYVEIVPELQQLAQHNMPLLGIKNEKLKIKSATESDNFSLLTFHFSFIFIDPARRDTAGRKTVGIGDCTPNLLEIQDELLAHAQWVMVKLSPMLDITEALRQLHGVSEVHVVSVRGECKELLFLATANSPTPNSPTIYCVNLETDDDIVTSPYPLPKRGHEPLEENFQSSIFNFQFLYEPNSSIQKAGLQDMLTERYPVRKLHPMSHLFVGDTMIPHFPGRRFRITGWSDFSKRGLKELLGDLRQANLTVRNFPTDVASLRRRLRLNEGGEDYLFATTQADGTHVLIRCRRAEESY